MTATGPVPAPIRIYAVAADIVAPLALRKVSQKLVRLGASSERLRERAGKPTLERPEGRMIWCHAASVGESLSILPLIRQMAQHKPDLNFLITSGTQTSASILADRLPARTLHQFAPLDSRRYLRRFLDHWRPDAALFVESELWPNMLRETRASGVAMALVNARISDRSVRRWKRFRSTARSLLDLFDVIHCQDDRTAAHLQSLGLQGARRGINLKALAGPLPVDEAALDHLRGNVKNRPLWLAASTHPGEDEIALAAHRFLRQAYPDALLLLAPRHPERATSIKALISAADLSVAQRSTGERPTPDCAVYLADTLGEMGLWYTLSPLTLLCGSFVDVGGHNPYEPAQTGSYILHGPHYANFEPAYRDLDGADAGEEVADAPAIADKVAQVWSHPESLQSKQAAARAFARQNEDGLESLAEHLFTRLRLS